MKLRFIFLFLLLFLSACGGGGGGDIGVSVSGQFVSSYVKGLKVCDDRGHCTYTDSYGRFYLADSSLPVNLSFFVDNLRVGSYLLKENGEVVNPFKIAGNWAAGDLLAKFIHGMAGDVNGTEEFIDLSGVTVVDSSLPEETSLKNALSENVTVALELRTENGDLFSVRYTPGEGVELCKGDLCYPVNYRRWLVLVYMAADNNLNNYAFKDLNEMASVNFTPQVKLVALTDFNTVADRISESDEFTGKLVSHDLDEVNSGNYTTLENFIRTYYNKYPAEKVALILWDHGDGWRATRMAALDDTSNNILTMFQLQKVLSDLSSEGINIDLIGFDECLMGMEEVLFDIKDFSDYFVVSEGYEPADGWNYKRVLTYLVSNPGVSVESFGRAIVDAYRDSYSSLDTSYTLTLTLFSRADVEKITSNLETLSSYFLDENATDTLIGDFISARNSAETIADAPGYVDLYSFALNLAEDYVEAKEVVETIDSLYKVVIRGSNDGALHGLSIYFPSDSKEADTTGFDCYVLETPGICDFGGIEVSGYYNPFASGTSWDEFLSKYLSLE